MGYILARGPAGLEEVLATLLEQSKTNPELKSKAQYVLYELGNQKSMIKIDMSVWPVVFWHYDLLGRPATSAVKDILSKFAWEKCGEKEWYYKEKGSSKPQDEAYLDWRSNIFEGKTGTE